MPDTAGSPDSLEIIPILGLTSAHDELDWPAAPIPHLVLDRAETRTNAATPPRAVDWGLVRALRTQAATELSSLLAASDDLNQQQAGTQVVSDLLRAHTTATMSGGQQAPSRLEMQELHRAVMDSLFRLGRLQPLVDDPTVENIEVTGCDDVKLTHADGSISLADPIAESDDELIENLQFLASRSGAAARPFSPAHPFLHLPLDGGGRLAACAWIVPRPSIVIRIHRLVRVTLDDLVDRDMLDLTQAQLLSAAVKAGKSIVVSGPQGSGKTTLVRALCAALDPWERIATLETERELFLHELPEQHHRVLSWESRPGSGDRGADGRLHGEVTLSAIVEASLRFNLSRLIVGEVRGQEVLAMFQAMQTGAGSMSTTHAHSARAAIERLVTCALEAGAHVTTEFAHRQVAEHIDIIVQLGLTVAGSGTQPTRHRFVSEVITVEPGEGGRAATTTLWRRPRFQARPRLGVLPAQLLEELRDFGLGDESAWAQFGGAA